ncbi:MAG: hypothetical protein JO157_16715 [Acetobacteraceae bacterium]|nr:hypothetical protein [Acetobacteraceae bacterium]
MRKLLLALTVGGAAFTVGFGAEAMPASGVSPVLIQAATTSAPAVQPVQYYRHPYHRHYRRPYNCYYRHGRRYCH